MNVRESSHRGPRPFTRTRPASRASCTRASASRRPKRTPRLCSGAPYVRSPAPVRRARARSVCLAIDMATAVVYQHAKRLARVLGLPLVLHRALAPTLGPAPAQAMTHKLDDVAPEVALVACVIVVLKLVYGLDGQPRFVRARPSPIQSFRQTLMHHLQSARERGRSSRRAPLARGLPRRGARRPNRRRADTRHAVQRAARPVRALPVRPSRSANRFRTAALNCLVFFPRRAEGLAAGTLDAYLAFSATALLGDAPAPGAPHCPSSPFIHADLGGIVGRQMATDCWTCISRGRRERISAEAGRAVGRPTRARVIRALRYVRRCLRWMHMPRCGPGSSTGCTTQGTMGASCLKSTNYC